MNLQRPDYCCGKCPETATGYDCTCRGNPRCEKNQARGIDGVTAAIDRLLAVCSDIKSFWRSN